MAHCKNDELEIMGLVVQASTEIITVLCAFHCILCLVLIQFMRQSDLIEKKIDWEENRLKHLYEYKHK